MLIKFFLIFLLFCLKFIFRFLEILILVCESKLFFCKFKSSLLLIKLVISKFFLLILVFNDLVFEKYNFEFMFESVFLMFDLKFCK